MILNRLCLLFLTVLLFSHTGIAKEVKAAAGCPEYDFPSDPDEVKFSELIQCINALKRRAVPKGVVAAFGEESCPDGWTPFHPAAGRFILGGGPHTSADVYGRRLTQHEILDQGGEESHLLILKEIPIEPQLRPDFSSNVGTTYQPDDWSERSEMGDIWGQLFPGDSWEQNRRDYGMVAATLVDEHTGTSAGKPKDEIRPTAHNNMPPYIALYFCKKE